MDNGVARSLAQALGSATVLDKHNGVAVTCPLAPWTHAKGKDSKPSAALLTDNNDARFNCFTCCQRSIGWLELVMRIASYQTQKPKVANMDLNAARNIAIWWEEHKPDPLELAANEIACTGQLVGHEHAQVRPWGENYLGQFISAKVLPYAYERGLTDELIDKLEVKYDAKRNRLVEPYRTFDGQLAGCHGRYILPTDPNDPEAPLRYYSYPNYFVDKDDGGRNNMVWMGENLVDLNYALVLTEGQFDKSQIYKAYPNVLASRSASISAPMFHRIRNARFLITYYDTGTGGDIARAKIEEMKSKHTSVIHLHPLESMGYTDAGETPHELIAQQLEKATGGWI